MLAALTDDDPDRIAFGRPPEAYRHAALMNHPRTDWAFTVARRFLYETADAIRLDALSRSSDPEIAGLAVKMRREETYHLLHWSAWVRRLAEGGAEPRERLIAAVERLWPEAEAVFAPLGGEDRLVEAGILPETMSRSARPMGGAEPMPSWRRLTSRPRPLPGPEPMDACGGPTTSAGCGASSPGCLPPSRVPRGDAATHTGRRRPRGGDLGGPR